MSKTDNNINATPQSSHSREGGNLELPTGWRITSLGEICDINPKYKLEDEMSVGFMPMSGVPKHYNGRCDFETRQWKDVKKGFTQFKNGDTIFAKITPCFENSKAAVIKNFPSGWGAGSTEYYVLRPIAEGINPQLLLATVKSKDFLNNGAVNMTGSVGHKRVPKDYVENYPIPLPPLAEQKVIADKLDELLAQVDTLKARLDAIPAILKRFRQSVLAAAVTGKLTEEWRTLNNEKTTKAMLNDFAFLPEPPRYKSRSTSFIAGVHATAVGKPEAPLTKEWAWIPLVKVARMESGHTPSRSKPEYWGGKVFWIGIKDARRNHEKTIYETEQTTNELGLANSASRLLPKDTVCISRTASVGYVVKMGSPMATSQDFVNWVPSKVINPDWLKWLFVAEKESLFRFGKGSTHTTVYFPEWLSMHIALPHIDEQTEIVRRVEQLLTHADQVEQQVKNAQARVNQLTQSILAKAFRGELSEQWRQDNPELITGDNSAAALLERIKAERAAATPANKKAPARKAKA